MTGRVDELGRALLKCSISASSNGPASDLAVWVDTAFTGDLLIPRPQLELLHLPPLDAVIGILADGQSSRYDAYQCWLNWFGERRETIAIASEGRMPLLGVSLLLGHRLSINYLTMRLTLR